MNYGKIKSLLKLKKYTYDILFLFIGCFIMATGTSIFLLPNQLSTGGFSGIATIGYYLLKIPMGATIFILNIPLFILSYIRLGKVFLAKSIIGTALLSIFIDFLEQFPPLTDDRFLASIYGGIIVGIGSSMILEANASTGGTELLAHTIRTYKPHFQTSTLIVIIDILIVTLNVIFFHNIEIGLYSAISIYLMGKMIDIVFEGINFTKIIFIVSDKYEKIAKEIDKNVERGSTAIYAKGMYTNENKMMLLCVASRNQISKIKHIAVKLDKNAFIIISNARETWGKGFKGFS